MLDQNEMDRLRRDFATRMNKLIGELEHEKNLENFSKKTGVAMRMLCQWRNPRHINWPSVKNLMAIARGAGVSLDWLVMGRK